MIGDFLFYSSLKILYQYNTWISGLTIGVIITVLNSTALHLPIG